MKVIITAGGTGGHIYPALAILEKLKEHEKIECLYIGTHNRMEKDLIPSFNIPYKSLEMYGFNRKNIFKNFKTIYHLLKSIKEAKKIISEYKPDVIIGAGGYISVPVIYAGYKLGIKTVIHEQNIKPGLANKILSKFATLVMVSFPDTINYFKNKNVCYTGNPCSYIALKEPSANLEEYNLSNDKKKVLIVMGSLGAKYINEYLYKQIDDFKNKPYEIIFVTGDNYYEMFKDIKHPNIHIFKYIPKLTKIMKVSDLIVSRAGASTLAEIMALSLPSILIPSPYVANNEQYYNALALKEKKAAYLLQEKDLQGDILVKTIDSLINDEKELTKLSNNLIKMGVDPTSSLIYDLIKGNYEK